MTRRSVKPACFHSRDLQVLSWDAIAHRWFVAFDAQKVEPSESFYGPPASNSGVTSPAAASPVSSKPLLDPKADVQIEQVDVLRFGPRLGTELVFTATNSVGGSGLPGELVVVSFKEHEARVDYSWSGDGGARYRVQGSAPHQRLITKAWYWTSADAHCCPVRKYSFVIGATQGSIGVVKDERPWLGLYVEAAQPASERSPLRVVGLADGSPAARQFLPGDEIVALEHPPAVKNQDVLATLLLDQIVSLNAGAQASFIVLRSGQTRTIALRVGSLIDQSALGGSAP